ncbi:methyltransferase domain-containing protein [Nocardia yunnanensis]|uniref:Methyltransferase domain-containing protein n=1 Tax=Nocardia yunnanensis TaxID=2382165 RepID=A0A386Z985_9NOCA|nr:methyltransferase domain-containing protein [Nocardia yunnanensis]AYF73664.1 methyltransferase domain-containing protein [Nocardia yunnanensis]
MATIRHEVAINAAPQHVWDVVRDIGAVHERLLHGRVTDIRIEGNHRFLTFPDGHVITELIISIDDNSRRLAYSVTSGARPPLDYHHASFEVQGQTNPARLIWTTDILPDTAAPEVRLRTHHGIAEMKQAIEATTPSGWLDDTRTSYDTVATTYADLTRHLLDETPEERAALASFAEIVRAQGGGLVADVGCGAGRITAHLRQLDVDAFGIDLSPGMIEVARRDHPGVRFEVGSMTNLARTDGSIAGLVAWYSLIHIPDDEISSVFDQFARVLRPGGPLLLGFHVGDDSQLKTPGYGGHAMQLHVYRRQHSRMRAWLDDAGFVVEADRTVTSAESPLGGIILARHNITDRITSLAARMPGQAP